jgi:hypothetical protein
LSTTSVVLPSPVVMDSMAFSFSETSASDDEVCAATAFDLFLVDLIGCCGGESI